MVSPSELIAVLKSDGWNLDQESIKSLLEGKKFSVQQATNELLNSDLKDVGTNSLHEDLMKGKKTSLSGPLILQVCKMRNVSAPKAFEESGGAPRILKVSLTDGSNIVNGIEVQSIKALSLKTAPGTKVRLNGKISVSGGFLLLTPHNTNVVGGVVQELYNKWSLSSSVSQYSRGVCTADGSTPPPWIPFGKKIIKNPMEMQKFKSLRDPEKKENDSDEFENQRKQAVKELSKEGNLKVFGGGKQMLDANVQKVINAGFSIDVAEWALRNSKNDPVKAIKELRSAATGSESNSQWDKPERNPGSRYVRSGRGQGKEKGKGGGGPDGSDDECDLPHMPRPSAPTSLFDFLDSKIIEKKETVSFAEPVTSGRSPLYNQIGRGSDNRGRDRGYQKRPRNQGGYINKGVVNDSATPPDMTAGNWPAPGEEKVIMSNRSYLESKELMEKHEKQENFLKKPAMEIASASHEYSLNCNPKSEQSYRRDDRRQNRNEYYNTNLDYRSDSCPRKDNVRRIPDSRAQEIDMSRRGNRGNHRMGGRYNSFSNNRAYMEEASGMDSYNENYSRDGSEKSNINYKHGNNSDWSRSRDSNYRGFGNNYSNSRNKRGSNVHYGGKYDQHYKGQQTYYNNYDTYERGNNRETERYRSQQYTPEQLEMIQDFQRSMTMSGHY